MARILVYTSPARGHLFPVIGAGLELDDVGTALRETDAEALLVDTNSWGAQAVAEASRLPWATFQSYFTRLPAAGVPPFGPGLRRSISGLGRIRDALLPAPHLLEDGPRSNACGQQDEGTPWTGRTCRHDRPPAPSAAGLLLHHRGTRVSACSLARKLPDGRAGKVGTAFRSTCVAGRNRLSDRSGHMLYRAAERPSHRRGGASGAAATGALRCGNERRIRAGGVSKRRGPELPR